MKILPAPPAGLLLIAAGLAAALVPSHVVADGTTCALLPPSGPFPAHVREARERMTEFQPETPGGWVHRTERLAQERSAYREGRIARDPSEHPTPANAAFGDLFVPILPILFDNSGPEPWNPVSLETALFVFSQTGTMTQYFDEVSYGNLNVTGDVWNWQRVAENDVYYEDGNQGLPGKIGDLFRETLALNDGFVNFGQYDNDGPDNVPNSGDDDGQVDVIVLVIPEIGGACGGNANIWPHQYFYSRYSGGAYETNDARAGGGAIRADRYVILGGLNCAGNMMDMGTLCHELGHALGIKDLYDTDDQVTGDSNGIGVWGLMGAGNWNMPTSPSHPTAWTKSLLGWMNLLNVAQDDPNLCLPPVETQPIALRLWAQGQTTTEYFVVENRQQLGFDQNLASEGLVIYHVDENTYVDKWDLNRVNADETHKAIDVECADAFSAGHVVDADDLDVAGMAGNRGDATDVFCQGGGENKFTPTSVPDSRAYSGAATGVSVRSVGPCAGLGGGDAPDYICAQYEVGVPSPVDVCIEDCDTDFCNAIATCSEWWGSPGIWIDHDGDGDDDYPTPGVSNRLWTRVVNRGLDPAVATTVQIYFARGAMGLEWPTDAEQMVGVTGYPVIHSGSSEVASLVFDYPEFPEGAGHYCIGAVIQQTYDPTFPGPANVTNNIAQVNHQILMDRGSLAEADRETRVASCGNVYFETWIQLYDGANPNGVSIAAEVRVGTPPNFDDAVLPPGWNLQIDPGTGPFFLTPVERDSVLVSIWSNSATSGQMAHVPLTLWNLDVGVPMGGTTIDAHVDCIAPAATQISHLDWLPPSGDDLDGPNVLLEWAPVDLDVEGGPEMVQFYEIARAHDGGVFSLADRVAVDADLDRPGFQWYDTVVRDCPGTWDYRMAVVDAAWNYSSVSGTVRLECTSAPVDAPVVASSIGGPSLAHEPNPARSQTDVRFEIASAGRVDIAIYNARGERVRHLWSGHRDAGVHRLPWNGRDDSGRPLASGVYFTRAELPGRTVTQKVVLMR